MRLYERQSKLGVYHTFHRKNTIYCFKCDSCGDTFLRPRAQVDPERASNDYKHVCSYCDSKKFAQKYNFKNRIVHGMLIGSFYSKFIGVDFPGKHSLILEICIKILLVIQLN